MSMVRRSFSSSSHHSFSVQEAPSSSQSIANDRAESDTPNNVVRCSLIFYPSPYLHSIVNTGPFERGACLPIKTFVGMNSSGSA